MLVFIQPKCIKYQHTYPGTSLLGAYFCVLFKPDKFQAALRRLSSTQAGDRPVSPLSDEFDNNNNNNYINDNEDIGFSHRIRVAIRRLSIATTARTGGGGMRGENPYVDGDGIGFQDYNSDQRRSSSVSNDDERRLSIMSNETDGDDTKHVAAGGMKRNVSSSAETEDVTLYSPRTTASSSSEGPA